MIKQHRLVNDLLKDDIKGMHGLQVRFLQWLDFSTGILSDTVSRSQLKTRAP